MTENCYFCVHILKSIFRRRLFQEIPNTYRWFILNMICLVFIRIYTRSKYNQTQTVLIDKLNFQVIRIISSIISSLSEKHSKHSFNWFEADTQAHSIAYGKHQKWKKKTKQITCPHFNLQNECFPFIVQIALSLILQSTPIAQMIKKKNDQFFFIFWYAIHQSPFWTSNLQFFSLYFAE